jgi:23S rRNA (cytidine1920-2'-O)/16S rRNA (cytidine1409-2'-O)-methyltransferase
VARRGRARLRALIEVVAEARPDVDALEAISAGRIVVDGRTLINPASLVRRDAAITIRDESGGALRGEAKLVAALRSFGVPVAGRVALDLGAAAGGFTRILLRAGARHVYAVDVGFGQLLGSLRQHPAVVNLERTNLAELSPQLIPETIEVVTADLSYLSLARAVPQLSGRVELAPYAELVAVVKPQFELGLRELPTEPRELERAVEHASEGIEQAGWTVTQAAESPVRGRRGAVEFLLHAVRRGGLRP